jgi:hypothetical protein
MNTALSRRLPRVLISATLALTASLASLWITTAPVEAAPSAGAYIATLAAPLAAPRREIIEGATWRCEGDRCAAPANGGRAMAVCGKVARKFGTITRFTSQQGELSAEQLARCNG